MGGSPESNQTMASREGWMGRENSLCRGPREGFHAWGLKSGPCGLREEDGRDLGARGSGEVRGGWTVHAVWRKGKGVLQNALDS